MDIQDLISRLIESGLTQKQIADEIGCAQPTISEIATGKVGKTRPSWKIVDGLRQLAERQGIAADPEDTPTLPYATPNGGKSREAKGPMTRLSIDPIKEKL